SFRSSSCRWRSSPASAFSSRRSPRISFFPINKGPSTRCKNALAQGRPSCTVSAVITRRRFLGAAAAAGLSGWTSAAFARGSAAADRPRVDPNTLRERLERLSVFGRPAGGTFADGVSRVAYSDADVAGRDYVIGLMKAAGLDPRIDPAGNIFGRRAGREASLPP